MRLLTRHAVPRCVAARLGQEAGTLATRVCEQCCALHRLRSLLPYLVVSLKRVCKMQTKDLMCNG
jgi:hypothetical protein